MRSSAPMRSALARSFLLLLAAAALPLPPAPPAEVPAPTTVPTSRAAAEAALERADASRKAALAAEEAARAHAKRAAAAREQLTAQRIQATVHLIGIERESGAIAEKLGQLSEQRREAERDLGAKKAALAPLLPLLERISLYPAATLLAVPEPPEQALRGALVIRGLARRIEQQAAEVRAEERKVAALSRQIGTKMAELGVAEAQQKAAADVLDSSIAATAAEESAANDAAGQAARRAAVAAGREQTLKGAITAIIEAARKRAEAARAAAAARAKAAAAKAKEQREELALAQPSFKGLPRAPTAVVAGVLVSRFGQPTPAGPAAGVRYATAPGAHVFAPCAGQIEFAAPFRTYGHVVILGCGHGDRFVLAGMQQLLVRTGASVPAGALLGTMPEWDPATSRNRPTLYLELHRGGTTVDPLPELQARG